MANAPGLIDSGYRGELKVILVNLGNEAVEIAKRFSTDDSGKFVNGILDNFRKQLNRDR